MERLQPIVGLLLIGLIAYSLSTNRKAIRLRTIAWGFGLQLLFALIVLKTSVGQQTFECSATRSGSCSAIRGGRLVARVRPARRPGRCGRGS